MVCVQCALYMHARAHTHTHTHTQVDLVKDNGHTYFIKYLDSVDGGVDLHSRAQAAFVLAAICDNHPKVSS